MVHAHSRVIATTSTDSAGRGTRRRGAGSLRPGGGGTGGSFAVGASADEPLDPEDAGGGGGGGGGGAVATPPAPTPAYAGTAAVVATAGMIALRAATSAGSGTAIGPRPATKPAASRAITVGPGTNQIQSTAECRPNTTAASASAAMPTRSAVHGCGAARRRTRTPTVRAAAISHDTSSTSDTSRPAVPRSAAVWWT